MTENKGLDDFLITKRWPAKHPELIQLYSFPTPNGVKISIALEELAVSYEAHKVTLSDEDVKSPEFLSLNPNNKIPAIIDPNGRNGKPIGIFESGAILVYLAEKYKQLLGNSASERLEILQWLMFQVGGVCPMFGQLGYFYYFAGKEIEDERPLMRYKTGVKRLLNVLNKHLENREWLVREFSIADIAIAPWLNILSFFKAEELLELASLTNVIAYIERFKQRPAVQKGLLIPSLD